jgi:hypothetical protein
MKIAWSYISIPLYVSWLFVELIIMGATLKIVNEFSDNVKVLDICGRSYNLKLHERIN